MARRKKELRRFVDEASSRCGLVSRTWAKGNPSLPPRRLGWLDRRVAKQKGGRPVPLVSKGAPGSRLGAVAETAGPRFRERIITPTKHWK